MTVMTKSLPRATQELRGLVEEVLNSKSKVRQRYGQSLMQSLEALDRFESTSGARPNLDSIDDFACRDYRCTKSCSGAI